MGKRVLALVLSGVLVFTSVDLTAFAAEIKTKDTVDASDAKVVDDVLETEVLADSEMDAGLSLSTDSEVDAGNSLPTDSEDQGMDSDSELDMNVSNEELIENEEDIVKEEPDGEETPVYEIDINEKTEESTWENREETKLELRDSEEKFAEEENVEYKGMESDDDGNIASGSYKDITWVIDADGLLTISGTGEFSDFDGHYRAPWGWRSSSYDASDIKSAKVNVTDLKNAKGMFSGCVNLTSVDFTDFDTKSVTDMGYMFEECNSLKNIEWGDFNTDSVTDMEYMFYRCYSLTDIDVSNFNTENVTSMKCMFYACENLTGLELNNFNTSKVTDMENMFGNCWNMANLDLGSFDTSNVTNMHSMFGFCRSLVSLDLGNFNTSKVTDMGSMFTGCISLTGLNLRNFDTSHVCSMNRMFMNCSSMPNIDLGSFNTSEVSENGFEAMFYGCSSLAALNLLNFDTSKATGMVWMFLGCKSLTGLDLSNFDTLNVSNMEGMFEDCSGLIELDLSSFDTSNVVNMKSMFWGCSGLTKLNVSGFNTTKVTRMGGMFFGCESLSTLDINNFRTANVTEIVQMFSGCAGLSYIDVSHFDTTNVKGFGSMFANCSSLTKLNLSNFSTSNATGTGDMFLGCSSLEEIVFPNIVLGGEYWKLMLAGCTNMKKLDFSHLSFRSEVASVSGFRYIFDSMSDVSVDLSYMDLTGVKNLDGMFWTSRVAELDLSHVRIPEGVETRGMFRQCTALTSLDLSDFDTTGVTDMSNMFRGCEKLANLDLGSFDTTMVTDMSYMFRDCEKLANLELGSFNTSKVTDMQEMFYGCKSLVNLDLSSFETSNATNMKSMFSGCPSLRALDFDNLCLSSETDVSGMFAYCSIEDLNIKNLNTSDLTHFKLSMLFKTSDISYDVKLPLQDLDISNWDTSNITDTSSMFSGCDKLTKLDLSNINTEKVTNMGGMFADCSRLIDLDLSNINTEKVTNMGGMFARCSSLTSLDLSSFNMSNVTDGGTSMFSDCDALVLLRTPINVKTEIRLPGIFYMQDGKSTNTLPMNLSESIVLAKNPGYYTGGSLMQGTSNDISWEIDKNGKLTITGTGDWDRSGVYKAPWLQYKSSIRSAEVTLSGTANASYMFSGCYRLNSIDVRNFSVSSVADMSYMFKDCFALTKINLTTWSTTSAQNMSGMFQYCSSLKELYLDTFDLSKVNNADSIVDGCEDLSVIKVSETLPADIVIELPAKFYYYNMDKTYLEISAANANTGITLKRLPVSIVPTDDSNAIVVPFRNTNLKIKWNTGMFEGNPEEENLDLAIAGLVLSAAAEQETAKTVKTVLERMGFSNKNMTAQHYGELFNAGNPAYTLALGDIILGGRKKTLVTVVIRGTTTLLGDGLTDLNAQLTFDGFTIPADSTYRGIKNVVQDYDPEELVFFVTGHSLGGATAVLVGQRINRDFDSSKTFVYAYAPPKYGKLDVYSENIFQYNNKCDAVPRMPDGIFNRVGKEMSFWGSDRQYYNMYFTLTGRNLPAFTGVQVFILDKIIKFAVDSLIDYDHSHHGPYIYMAYLLTRSKTTIEEYHPPKTNDRWYIISVKCPVDVSVYDSGNTLLARIVDNVIDTSVKSENVIPAVDGDEKYFLVAADSDVKVKITGSDAGTMEYSVISMQPGVEEEFTKTFEAVQLEKGKEFSSELVVEKDATSVELYVTDPETGIPTSEVHTDGTEEVLVKIYTVTFDPDGGTAIDPQTVNENEKAAEPAAPVKEGFTFVGWYLGETQFDFNTPVTADITLKAVWKKMFTVTFDSDGGTAVAPQTVIENEKATEPTAPAKEGFTFAGWYLSETLFDFGTAITSDITLKAGWKAAGETEEPNAPEEPNPDNPSPEDPSKPGEPDIPENLAKWGDILPEDRPADGLIPIGLWIAGIDENGYAYNGSAIKPAVRVYDSNLMLKAKRDYAITYARNIKANTSSKASKAPVVKVKGKGNYSGTETATFKINPIDITELAKVNNIYVPYSGKAQKPVPAVKVNGKTLKKKVDFKYSYKDSTGKNVKSCKAPGTYQIVISGVKNYSGTKTIDFVIAQKSVKLMSKATVSKIADKPYTGNAITLTDADQFTVKHGAVTLTENEHYTLSYRNNQAVGTAAVIVKAIEGSGYAGEKVVTFKITGEDISKASVSGIFDVEYSGRAARQDALALTFDSTPLQKDTDYTVAYQNNVDAGTAELVITGKGKYTGSIKKTFKITSCNVENPAFKVADIADARYAKGGCKPEPAITFTDGAGKVIRLAKDKDYTLSYSSNQNVGEGTLQITGKGNFTGSKTVSFSIGQQDFKNVRIEVSDKVYSAKKDAHKSAVKVYDPDGTALKFGVDYDGNVTYTYADGTEIGDTVPPVGSEIKVTVAVMGSNYSGIGEAVYRITKASIAKAKVTVVNPAKKNKNMFEYTGKPVTITKENLKVKVGKTTLTSDQYEILEDTYKDNVKRGTASVQIRGLGDYGGTVTVKFKIGTKGFKWFWRLMEKLGSN